MFLQLCVDHPFHHIDLFFEGKNVSLNKSGNAGCATYDRFIPNRSLMDNDRSHLLLMRDEKENDSTVNTADSSDASYMESMRASLVESNSKILTMKCKAPTSTDGNKFLKFLAVALAF